MINNLVKPNKILKSEFSIITWIFVLLVILLATPLIVFLLPLVVLLFLNIDKDFEGY
jgi:hypothetical protein